MLSDLEISKAVEMESALVGALIMEPSELPKVAAIVRSEDFLHEPARIVFESIKFLGADGPVDAVLILEDLRNRRLIDAVGGATAVAAFTDAANTSAHAEAYAERVADAAKERRQRQAIEKAYIAVERGEPLSQIIAVLRSDLDAAEVFGNQKLTAKSIADIIDTCLNSDSPAPTISTGYRYFDVLHGGGLCPGDLTIIGAAPSLGKSQFMLNLEARMRVGDRRARVLHVSLEMPARDVVARQVALMGHLNSATARTILRGRANANTQQMFGWAFEEGIRAASALPVEIIDGSFRPEGLRALAAKYDGRIDVMVVDYLQRLSGSKGQKTLDRVAEASKTCKDIALTHDIHVLAVSSLNRDGYRSDARPSLANLRETGDIEFDADNVWLLWREKKKGVNEEDMEVLIEKQRNGPIDMVPFRFDLPTGEITEQARGEEQ